MSLSLFSLFFFYKILSALHTVSENACFLVFFSDLCSIFSSTFVNYGAQIRKNQKSSNFTYCVKR